MESHKLLSIPVSRISALLGHHRFSRDSRHRFPGRFSSEHVAELLLRSDNIWIAERLIATAYGPDFQLRPANSETARNEKSAIRTLLLDENFMDFVNSERITHDERSRMQKASKTAADRFKVTEIDGVSIAHFGFVERGRKFESQTVQKIEDVFSVSDKKIVDIHREYDRTFSVCFPIPVPGEEQHCFDYRICGKSDAVCDDGGVLEIKNRIYGFRKLSHEIDQVSIYAALGGHSYGMVVQQFDGEIRFSRMFTKNECLRRWETLKRELESMVGVIGRAMRSRELAREFVDEVFGDLVVPRVPPVDSDDFRRFPSEIESIRGSPPEFVFRNSRQCFDDIAEDISIYLIASAGRAGFGVSDGVQS